MALRAFDLFKQFEGRAPSAKELYQQQWPDAEAADLQGALDQTAALIKPAAEAVLDDPELTEPIAKSDEPVAEPVQKLDPEPVPDVPDAGTGSMLTLDMLKKRWPKASAKLVKGMANTAGVLEKLGIRTRRCAAAHFMGQISQECGRGTEMVESLNYTAARMMKVFPKRFPTLASTQGFVPGTNEHSATKYITAEWAIAPVAMMASASAVEADCSSQAVKTTRRSEKAAALIW